VARKPNNAEAYFFLGGGGRGAAVTLPMSKLNKIEMTIVNFMVEEIVDICPPVVV
jgi:shikimate 5-dehydrogenase